jgi:hypothetical protein
MGTFPPPAPFVVSTEIDATRWIDDALEPLGRLQAGALVGEIVPSGFEAYARVFHPARRFFGRSIEQTVALRWSEIAAARGKTAHAEMQIEVLIDNADAFDYEHWKAISTGGGEWFPPYEWLEALEALALVSVLRPFTATPDDAWLMLWDGYGDLGPEIDGVPRAMIHADRFGAPLRPELAGRTLAFRHYLVFRGRLDGLAEWFRWRDEGPNYWWPRDRSWIVVTEIDGFSTYVGASRRCIEGLLASPLLEAPPSALDHRFDIWGDSINGPPK